MKYRRWFGPSMCASDFAFLRLLSGCTYPLLMRLRGCMQGMAALSSPFSYLPGALSVRVLFLLDCYAAPPPLAAVMFE
jgi:hypothetical protein